MLDDILFVYVCVYVFVYVPLSTINVIVFEPSTKQNMTEMLFTPPFNASWETQSNQTATNLFPVNRVKAT